MSWCSTNGRPATSISAFGMRSVTGRMRVARPPDRIATGKMASTDGGGMRSSLREHFGALEVHVEAHFGQARLAHDMAQPYLLFRIEHQESAAAGADQLAAD